MSLTIKKKILIIDDNQSVTTFNTEGEKEKVLKNHKTNSHQEFDNIPTAGYSIEGWSYPDSNGMSVIHPNNGKFYISFTTALFDNCTIIKGIIQEKCVIAKNGRYYTLLPETSPEYDIALKGDIEYISPSKLKMGEGCESKSIKNQIFIGSSIATYEIKVSYQDTKNSPVKEKRYNIKDDERYWFVYKDWRHNEKIISSSKSTKLKLNGQKQSDEFVKNHQKNFTIGKEVKSWETPMKIHKLLSDKIQEELNGCIINQKKYTIINMDWGLKKKFNILLKGL